MSKASEIFHYFRLLPPEIQAMIWRHALPGPRVVPISLDELSEEPYTTKRPFESTWFVSNIGKGVNHRQAYSPSIATMELAGPCKDLPLLYVCYTSRMIAKSDYKQLFKSTMNPVGTYVRPDYDTILLSSTGSTDGSSYDVGGLANLSLVTSIEGNKIENIAYQDETRLAAWCVRPFPRSHPHRYQMGRLAIEHLRRFFPQMKTIHLIDSFNEPWVANLCEKTSPVADWSDAPRVKQLSLINEYLDQLAKAMYEDDNVDGLDQLKKLKIIARKPFEPLLLDPQATRDLEKNQTEPDESYVAAFEALQKCIHESLPIFHENIDSTWMEEGANYDLYRDAYQNNLGPAIFHVEWRAAPGVEVKYMDDEMDIDVENLA